ncbi:bifunctional DNA-formamidopyrimidine glycosylase/DNA-(apurinic or apyrimidinic site) lyase [bacterium]|jgi:formamidopyrimidine-DNA glycosylase|nr:bifunctional DNA-formamidopyrimidine glycosylase/DNA-(apurinic or apyrimidinic site) lyase [bacterium]
MPELPEVETVRRGLLPVLENRVLETVTVRRRDLRFPIPAQLAKRLTGATVAALDRRAKYILMRMTNGYVAILHLGMSGRIKIWHPGMAGMGKKPDLETHDHVIFTTDQGAMVIFNDPRRFGSLLLSSDNELADHKLLKDLGPEPFDPAFDGAALAARLKGRNTSIKAALLDQRTVAGLGNIYVSESLFRAGISPKRLARTVQGGRATKLHQAIQDVLTDAIAAGGSTLRDHRQPDGELGYFQHQFAVYDQTSKACPGCTCSIRKTGGIKQIVQSGRSTFYCARMQR